MNKRYWTLFWIKSSRGTDNQIVVTYPKKPESSDIKHDLEYWCSKFGAWTSSDNVVSYGWKHVKEMPKKVATKKWRLALKKMFKSNKDSKLAAAFMQPYKREKLEW
jgi:hypothetical protein